VDVLETAAQSRTHVNGVAVREVLDEEWVDKDCNMTPDEKRASTRDWYAEDMAGNDWYMGEATEAYVFDECDRQVGLACLDGSWKDGADVAGVGTNAEAGIIRVERARGRLRRAPVVLREPRLRADRGERERQDGDRRPAQRGADAVTAC